MCWDGGGRGKNRRSRKPVCPQGHRGFESLPVRRRAMGIWNSTLVYVGARTLLAAAMVALLLRRRVGVWHTGGQIVSDLSCAAFLLAYVNPDIREDVGVLVIPLDRKSTRLNSSHSQISY